MPSQKRIVLENLDATDFTGWGTDNSKFKEQFDRVVKTL